MLYLQFAVDGLRYLLGTRHVIEVAPLVPLKPLPHAPAHVAGLMNYRGRSLPILDASRLLAGNEAAAHLSTRIVVLKLVMPEWGERDIGLLLEQATEIVKLDEAEFGDAGIENPETAYLGKVAMDAQGMLQRITPDRLLSEGDAERLFSPSSDGN